ncbi:hypothetical protein OG930_43110 [Streptomyces sp. NBC_01799]|nr:hypothetical protein OG930_43110 [Streptomyces sp. NBC_01799]
MTFRGSVPDNDTIAHLPLLAGADAPAGPEYARAGRGSAISGALTDVPSGLWERVACERLVAEVRAGAGSGPLPSVLDDIDGEPATGVSS